MRVATFTARAARAAIVHEDEIKRLMRQANPSMVDLLIASFTAGYVKGYLEGAEDEDEIAQTKGRRR